MMRHANGMSISCDYALMSRGSHVAFCVRHYTENCADRTPDKDWTFECEYFLNETS